MENKTKGAGDDYPVIPMSEGSDKKEQIWSTFIEDYAFQVPYNGTNEFYDKEKLNDFKLKYSFQKAVNAHFNMMEKELASLKEVVKELIPIAELYYRMQTLNPKSLVADNIDIFNVIDRAKRLSDNK